MHTCNLGCDPHGGSKWAECYHRLTYVFMHKICINACIIMVTPLRLHSNLTVNNATYRLNEKLKFAET